ncbi:MAG: hypothetical protein WA162_08170 [Thermodesulfobacteriota bacterium]
MKKMLYIHIGSPKTGTTAIQEFFYVNRGSLEKAGLLYPVIDEDPFRIRTNGRFVSNKELHGKFFEAVKKTRCQRTLISEEMLFLNNHLDFLSCEELKKYDVKVICYLRNCIEYLSSLWGERSKLFNGTWTIAPISLEEFLADNSYASDLENIYKLADIFGRENILIKTFEKEMFKDSGLLDDFFDALGMEAPGGMVSVGDRNVSPPRKNCDVINFIKSTNPGLSESEAYERLFDLVGGDGRKIIETIDDELIERVVARTYPIERRIAKDFLGRRELFSSKYPKVYKEEREPYAPLSNLDLKKILTFIDVNVANSKGCLIE